MRKLTSRSCEILFCVLLHLISATLLSWRLWLPEYRAYETFWGRNTLQITLYLEAVFTVLSLMLRLSVDYTFVFSSPNKAARTAFALDYLQDNLHLIVSDQRALEFATTIKQIAAVRAAIQKEHLERSV